LLIAENKLFLWRLIRSLKMNERITLKDKIFERYIPEHTIVEAIRRIACDLIRDMEGRNPLFVGILNGAYMFVAELMSKLPPACELTFAAYASYRGTKSEGIVKELLPIHIDNKDRPVILLEDIIDTGLTMQYVMNHLRDAGAADVRLATMFIKPGSLKCDIRPDYVGLAIDDDFIVGFGLDYDGYGRSMRSIYKIVK
jgi:hypoxanthine phosphoribosyltransferase